ncbi:hypothetical protein SLEP1_g42777 [Rubroshorea leprosula]|uniref:Uncharacterized protein n=1 Tax=Rubroshorea leprosula TaxID=152421 RepID=A0AAV5LBL4_9ROSI|nr:hypothetical protein SLEP1_g42777 [Rubroshorea leprosula]
MEPNPGFRRTQAWVQRNPSVGSSNQLGSMELDPGFRRTQAWVQRNPGVGSKNPERLGSSNQLGSMELDPGFEEPSTPGFEEPSTPGFEEPSTPGFEMMMMNIYIFSTVGLVFDDDEESKSRKRKEKKKALFGFDSTQAWVQRNPGVGSTEPRRGFNGTQHAWVRDDDDEESKARKRKEKKRALFGFDSTQLVNDEVSSSLLLKKVKKAVHGFFNLPTEEKKKSWRYPGEVEGFGQLFVGIGGAKA